MEGGRLRLWMVAVLVAGGSRCARPEGTTETPSSTSAAGASPVETVDASTDVTSKDRDPEQELQKMARSKAKSRDAETKLRSGELEAAVDLARDALKLHELNVSAMVVLAEVFYRQGKYELVQAVTSSALTVDGAVRSPEETSRVYNLKGFALIARGDLNQATQAFRKAVEADDKNAAAWNNLGTRYLDSGDIKTARSCFEYALELQPNFARAHLNLGAALRAAGELKPSEAALQAALRLQPRYPEAFFNLGVLYLDADPFPGLALKERLELAIEYFDRYKAASVETGPTAATQPSALVSHERADDYIRVAHKGLDREQRRLEREQNRDKDGAEDANASSSETDDGSTDHKPETGP